MFTYFTGDPAMRHRGLIEEPVGGPAAAHSNPQDAGASTLDVAAPCAWPPSAAPMDFGVVVGGEAQASGNQTGVTGWVETDVAHFGRQTMVFGEASFTAFAGSQTGDADAAALTFAQVSGGTMLFAEQSEAHGGTGPTAWASSVLEFVAVEQPTHVRPGPWRHHLDHGDIATAYAKWLTADSAKASDLPDLSAGNWADVQAHAQAHGGSAETFTLTHSLVIEHHFSAVSGLGLVIA
jgi:hypothetical protein